MSTQTMWSYKDTLRSNDQRQFTIKNASVKNCWEVVQEASAFAFNVCSDCLVYVAKQKNSTISKRELNDIIDLRGAEFLSGRTCQQFTNAMEK